MHRRVNGATGRLLGLAALVCAAAGPASAQQNSRQGSQQTAALSDAAEEISGGGGDIELGAHLGIATGGRVSPGGLHLGAVLLYQLSSIDWFEGALDFTAGTGRPACFTERTGEYLCNHGALSGRALEISAGVRRFLKPQDQFTPYAQVRVGARFVSFPDDDVRGFAIPVIAGAGVRAQVNDFLTIGGGAALQAGVGWFNQNLGVEPQISLIVQTGVEFRLP